jgi:biopolymer transport protein ExbD
MREAAVGREDWKVVIKGDARLTYGEVRRTMYAIEAAGFADVGLIASPEEES